MTDRELRDLIEQRVAIEDVVTKIIATFRETGWLPPDEVKDAVLAEREACCKIMCWCCAENFKVRRMEVPNPLDVGTIVYWEHYWPTTHRWVHCTSSSIRARSQP